VAVETREVGPRDEVPGRLGRVLRLVDAGPRPFYRSALASLALTSLGIMAIGSFVDPGRSLRVPQREMIDAALAAFCISALLAILSLLVRGWDRPAWLDRAVDPRTRSAIWLALTVWFPFLLVVAYLRAKATFPQTVQWINFGFTDKRWETASYLLCALAPALLLTAAARVLQAGRDHPPSWRAWLAGLFPRGSTDRTATTDAATTDAATTDAAAPDAGAAAPDAATAASTRRSAVGAGAPPWRRALIVAAGVATALGLAWYFLGPPWYVSHTPTGISDQEDLFLGGFQAIASGHLPYVGVAGNQYGPGTQIVCYWLMKHVTSFSVVGFRQSWALLQWAGASVLFVAFFLAFGYVRGLLVSLLSALVYPTLREVAFLPAGHFDGYWAWANPLRYAGAVALVLLLPAIIRRCPSWRGIVGGAAMGLVWGVMTYMAQENLAAGVVGALALSALLLLTGTFSFRAVATGLTAIAGGFALVWLPALGFYAAQGDLASFIHLYFLIPRAVADGYSNSTWQADDNHLPSPLTTMFYALPVVLAITALVSVFEVRPLRIATRWSRERMLLAGSVLATILLYQGALLRSDSTHLTGTLLAVPALIVAGVTTLPRLLGGRRLVTVIGAGAVLAAASFALLPYSAYSPSGVRTAAEAPYLDRQQPASGSGVGQPATLAASRIGSGFASAPDCCKSASESMASFIATMNHLHAIIGNRVTYVVDVPNGYPGLVYFTADLNPAPVQYDKYTTVFNVPQLRQFMAYFRTYVVARTQALVSTSLKAPEATYFLERYPNARKIDLSLAGQPYYVLLAPNTGR